MTEVFNYLTVPYCGKGSAWGEEELSAMREAAKQDSLSFGSHLDEFEKHFADYIGCKHAIGVRSCTAALFLSTKALNIKDGDEVITTPLTFIATSLPLLDARAKVVFADIDPLTLNIDPRDVERKITSRTRAIYVVHYAGLAVDMDPILALAGKHNLAVVEDAAHAVGSSYKGTKVGNLGNLTCFSFQSLKNMTCHGEGGMVTTNDDSLAEKMKLLRNYGIKHLPDRPHRYGNRNFDVPYYWDVVDADGQVGAHYRMNELEAAAGLVQLRKLDENVKKRRAIGQHFSNHFRNIKGLTVPSEPAGSYHTYHLYPLLVDENVFKSKEDFMRLLFEEERIDVWLQYCPNYLYTIYQKRGYKRGLCPVCEDIFFTKLLNLPINPLLTDSQIEHVISAVKRTAEKLLLRK